MALVLSVLLWLLLAALAMILLLVLTPVHLRARVEKEAGWRGRVVVAPFGGLVPIPVFDSRTARKPAARKSKPEKSRRRGRRAGGGAVSPARIAGAVPELLAELLGAIRIDRLEVEARFGLDDPAETGALYGRLTPILFGLGARPPVALAVAPVFSGPELGGRAMADVSLIPARWLPPALRFAWRAFGPVR
jgi:hypothetical protein